MASADYNKLMFLMVWFNEGGKLTFYPLGNVSFFSKSTFFEKYCQDYHQCVKQIGSRSGPTFCRALSGSKLFAEVVG